MLTFITSSFGLDFNMGFIPYGDVWRRSRRELQASLRPADLESYQPIEQRGIAFFATYSLPRTTSNSTSGSQLRKL